MLQTCVSVEGGRHILCQVKFVYARKNLPLTFIYVKLAKTNSGRIQNKTSIFYAPSIGLVIVQLIGKPLDFHSGKSWFEFQRGHLLY